MRFIPSMVQMYAWLATFCGQALLCARLLRQSNKSFAMFRAYALTQAAFSLLVAAALEGPYYFAAYYACTVATGVLTLFAALEVYRRVFGPRRALPKWVPEKTAASVATALLSGIVFAALLHICAGGPWTKLMMKIEQALAIAGWASFAILGIYSRQLGIPWRDRAAKITAGFLFYLTVSILTVFVRSQSAQPAIAAGLAQQIGYLIAVFWWVFTLRNPEPVVDLDVGEILADCGTAIDAFRSVGHQLAR